MGGIFISYRRDDSRHAAGRLVDRLGQKFTREQLFMDVDAIEPGLDFLKVINQKVSACDVMLAVIGPNWLNAADENGKRRLDNPRDFVRMEVEAALARDIRVIPVLVDGAQMPREEQLPAPLRPIVLRNAVRLAHERFGAEADALAKSLASVVTPQRRGWFASGSAAAIDVANHQTKASAAPRAQPLVAASISLPRLTGFPWFAWIAGTLVGLPSGLGILGGLIELTLLSKANNGNYKDLEIGRAHV